MRWRFLTRRGERGDVVLATVGISLILSLLMASLVAVVVYEARIARLQSDSDQAYWLARGTALRVVQQLLAKVDVPSKETAHVANMTVTTFVEKGAVWTVYVTADSRQATSTLVFTYDPSLSRVIEWKENQPRTVNKEAP